MITLEIIIFKKEKHEQNIIVMVARGYEKRRAITETDKFGGTHKTLLLLLLLLKVHTKHLYGRTLTLLHAS